MNVFIVAESEDRNWSKFDIVAVFSSESLALDFIRECRVGGLYYKMQEYPVFTYVPGTP